MIFHRFLFLPAHFYSVLLLSEKVLYTRTTSCSFLLYMLKCSLISEKSHYFPLLKRKKNRSESHPFPFSTKRSYLSALPMGEANCESQVFHIIKNFIFAKLMFHHYSNLWNSNLNYPIKYLLLTHPTTHNLIIKIN